MYKLFEQDYGLAYCETMPAISIYLIVFLGAHWLE